MRDTLLLVLACVGGTSVILTGCLAMWVAGNACVDWYDRMLTDREENARAERAAAKWGHYVLMTNRRRSDISRLTEGWARYSSVDELIAESVDELIAESGRRAGARGESDG